MHTPLEWEALEHHPHEKTADWFWAVGIIAISIALTSLFVGNIIFALLVLAGAITLALHASQPPKIFQVKIDERGVTIDHFHYAYEAIESFWINEKETPPALLLYSQRIFFPLVVIRLEDMNVDDVRDVLLAHIPEKEHHEPLLQKVAERLGF